MKTLLATLGALLLLGSWVAQQFFTDRWSGRLAEIQAALTHFYIYQSNKSLFDAFYLLSPQPSHDALFKLQKENYAYGLERLRSSLSEERKAELSPLIAKQAKEYAGMGEYAQFQAEIVVIQLQLFKERDAIAAAKARAQKVFWAFYLLGSILVVASGFLQPSESKPT
jgi:hypothetical protein